MAKKVGRTWGRVQTLGRFLQNMTPLRGPRQICRTTVQLSENRITMSDDAADAASSHSLIPPLPTLGSFVIIAIAAASLAEYGQQRLGLDDQ